MRRALAIILVLLGSGTLSGCGYTWGSTYSDRVSTVSLPIFDNTTFQTGIEADLTDAIAKRLQTQTPWRITQGQAADTTLSGTIRDARLQTLSIVPETGLAQEQSLTLIVDFEWRDNRTGELLLERQNFQAASTFIPAQGVAGGPGERLEMGQRDAIDELARRIVGELRSAW